MVAIKALSVLAVAGSVIAAPATDAGSAVEARGAPFGYGYKWGDNAADSEVPSNTEGDKKPHVVVENKVVYETQYVTIPWGSRPPRPTQPPAAPAPSQPEQPAQPAQPEQTWQDAPAPSQSASPPSGGSDTGYMAIVNEYRAKIGLPSLQHSDKLEANAKDASQSAGGKLVHKLNPGSFGQVMAPGSIAEDFEHVFVGGWLCEIPSLLPGGECAEQSKGWNYQGQTGHAEILTDPKYKEIGCGDGTGIVTCDVA